MFESPIIDSAMGDTEAFDGLDPLCPEIIQKRQRLLAVRYFSFDGKLHQGQLVIHEELEKDVQAIFHIALEIRFPIHSVIPISHPRFRKDGRWDDDLSMTANNSPAFNYREITGGGRLSHHAHGRAIDINPMQNPYIKGNLVLPCNARYVPGTDGTLTDDHPVCQKFLDLGWDWGGHWDTRQDYQHFEKPLP